MTPFICQDGHYKTKQNDKNKIPENNVLVRMWRNLNPCTQVVAIFSLKVTENNVDAPKKINNKTTLGPSNT